MKTVSLVMLSLWLTGCGASLTTEQTITIEMYGVSVEPTGSTPADTNIDPLFQTYTLAAVNFTDSDGGVATLSAATDLVATKIVNRPIIIFNKDM